MSDLETKVAALAQKFAVALIAAVRAASLEEVGRLATGRPSTLPAKKPTRNRARRPKPPPSERLPSVQRRLDAVATFVAKHPGCSTTDVSKGLKLNHRAARRALAEATAAGSIERFGGGRGTRYRAPRW